MSVSSVSSCVSSHHSRCTLLSLSKMDDPEALLPAIERRTKQLRQQEQMLREAVTAASRRKETSAAALRAAEDAHQQLLRDRFPALNAQVNAQLDAMAAHAAAIAAFLSPARESPVISRAPSLATLLLPSPSIPRLLTTGPGSLAMVAGVEPLLEAQEEVALQHEVWKRRQFDEGPSRAVAAEGLGQYSPCDLNALDAGVTASNHMPDAMYRRNIMELKHVHDLWVPEVMRCLHVASLPSSPALFSSSLHTIALLPFPFSSAPPHGNALHVSFPMHALTPPAPFLSDPRPINRACSPPPCVRPPGRGRQSSATWRPWWTRPAGPSGGGRLGGESVGEAAEGERCTCESSATWRPWWMRPAGPSGGGQWAAAPFPRPFTRLLLLPAPSPMHPHILASAQPPGDYDLKIQRQRFYLAKMHQLLTQQYWQLAVNVALHGAVLLDAHHLERTQKLLLLLHRDTAGMQAGMVELLSSPHATPSSTAAHAMPLHLSPPALLDERLRVERQLSDDVAPAIDRLAEEWQTTQRSAVHAPRHAIRQRVLHSFFSPGALSHALLLAHSAQGVGLEGEGHQGGGLEGGGQEVREAQGRTNGQRRESRGGGCEGSGMDGSMDDGGAMDQGMGREGGMHVGMGMGMEEDDDNIIF
ncbi:unnamed protein product [Closterium sp. Yama58-4]|nr:unnamed protein product [Closterium sp. Yama58-4]